MKNNMELKETADMMCSADYKERFKAEYYQLKIRFEKLTKMCEKWDAGQLDFTPTCPRQIYYIQIYAMHLYLQVLESRAEMENIKL